MPVSEVINLITHPDRDKQSHDRFMEAVVPIMHSSSKNNQNNNNNKNQIKKRNTISNTDKRGRGGIRRKLQYDPGNVENTIINSESQVKQFVISKTINNHFYFYLVVVVIRLLSETAFLFAQYYLFGFKVAKMLKCGLFPCPGDLVDCFVSRSTEKTIFLNFMFGFTCLCIVLNFVEIIYLITTFIMKNNVLKKIEDKKKRSGIISAKNSGGSATQIRQNQRSDLTILGRSHLETIQSIDLPESAEPSRRDPIKRIRCWFGHRNLKFNYAQKKRKRNLSVFLVKHKSHLPKFIFNHLSSIISPISSVFSKPSSDQALERKSQEDDKKSNDIKSDQDVIYYQEIDMELATVNHDLFEQNPEEDGNGGERLGNVENEADRVEPDQDAGDLINEIEAIEAEEGGNLEDGEQF